MDAEALGLVLRAIAFAKRKLPRASSERALRMFAEAVGRWGRTDADLLAAVVLHETIEAGAADADMLADVFGPRVAELVGHVTRDRRLPLERRERAFAESARRAPPEARLILLLGIQDGLQQSAPPKEWLDWKLEETRALCDGLPDAYQPVVARLTALFIARARRNGT